MPKADLRVVGKAEPVLPPVDITLALRAEIQARDWAAVHVAADRAPVSLRDRLRRLLR